MMNYGNVVNFTTRNSTWCLLLHSILIACIIFKLYLCSFESLSLRVTCTIIVDFMCISLEIIDKRWWVVELWLGWITVETTSHDTKIHDTRVPRFKLLFGSRKVLFKSRNPCVGNANNVFDPFRKFNIFNIVLKTLLLHWQKIYFSIQLMDTTNAIHSLTYFPFTLLQPQNRYKLQICTYVKYISVSCHSNINLIP